MSKRYNIFLLMIPIKTSQSCCSLKSWSIQYLYWKFKLNTVRFAYLCCDNFWGVNFCNAQMSPLQCSLVLTLSDIKRILLWAYIIYIQSINLNSLYIKLNMSYSKEMKNYIPRIVSLCLINTPICELATVKILSILYMHPKKIMWDD